MNASSIRIGFFVIAMSTAPAMSDVLWNSGAPLPSGNVPSMGWNTSVATPYRWAMVDDFDLVNRSDLTRLTCYGHVTGNSINEPRVLGAYVQIMTDNAGVPGDLVFGGWEKSLPFTETFTGAFHSGSTSRPIYRVDIELPSVQLCPGRYWVKYNVDQNDIRPATGAADANFFSQIATPMPPDGNGLQMNVFTGQTFSLLNNAPAFAIEGFTIPECAPAGDFNGDGLCTPEDVPGLIERLLDCVYFDCVDVNADCEMKRFDVQAFVNACLS